MGQWKQSIYIVKNPSKYIGDCSNGVKYKSSLEQRTMYALDTNVNVLKWCYERHTVDYNKPIFNANGKISHIEVRKYYLDFFATIRNNNGTINNYLIEVKSLTETKPPIAPKKKTTKAMHRYKYACETYLINTSKWNQAEKYCESKGWKFILLTDDKIY